MWVHGAFRWSRFEHGSVREILLQAAQGLVVVHFHAVHVVKVYGNGPSRVPPCDAKVRVHVPRDEIYHRLWGNGSHHG